MERADQNREWPVLCAWCEKEGRETVLNWIAVKGSHGICQEHRAELLEQARIIKGKGQKQIGFAG